MDANVSAETLAILQPDMISSLGEEPSKCTSSEKQAYCHYNLGVCDAVYNGTSRCHDGVAYCYVYTDGSASCG